MATVSWSERQHDYQDSERFTYRWVGMNEDDVGLERDTTPSMHFHTAMNMCGMVSEGGVGAEIQHSSDGVTWTTLYQASPGIPFIVHGVPNGLVRPKIRSGVGAQNKTVWLTWTAVRN